MTVTRTYHVTKPAPVQEPDEYDRAVAYAKQQHRPECESPPRLRPLAAHPRRGTAPRLEQGVINYLLSRTVLSLVITLNAAATLLLLWHWVNS